LDKINRKFFKFSSRLESEETVWKGHLEKFVDENESDYGAARSGSQDSPSVGWKTFAFIAGKHLFRLIDIKFMGNSYFDGVEAELK
jgi:hypothetical protein